MENNKIKKEINDIVNDNLKALEQLFPSAVKDGQLDIKALKEELGDFEEVGNERYELNWAGKQNAKKIVQQGIGNKTLKFVEKDSKNADTTENIYIEGDNLEVLKLLRQNYYNSIKMIYIDPPYNTGNDFVYNDTFKMDKEESAKAEGIISENNEKLQKNQKSTNRYHANWLNMMYPRLKLARDLLTDDGVIFISIDDNEQANLKRLCDEIFGEENFVSKIIWINNLRGRSIDKYVSNTTDYILLYSKNMQKVSINPLIVNDENMLKEYSYKDEISRYKIGDPLFNNNSKFNIETRPNLVYSIYYNLDTEEVECIDEKKVKDGNIIIEEKSEKSKPWVKIIPPIRSTNGKRGCWRWSKELFIEKYKTELVLNQKKDGTYMFFQKNRLSKDGEKFLKYKNIIQNITSSKGTQELINILNSKIFDNPKPSKLLLIILEMVTNKNDIILDFFSGSATTAHAVMKLNSEDNGNRKYIMVQLPETTDEKSEAFKAGYKNIAEIGKERIRRAGEKIKQKVEEYNSNLKLGEEPKKVPDIGFKVFKMDDTNIKWYDLENFNEESQYSFNDPDSLDFVLGSNDIDIVYEIMLRQNDVPLSESLEVLTDIGNRTYLYASTYLICLETEITEEMVEKLALLEPLPIKFVFRDSAFKDNISLKDETFRKLRSLIERNSGESKVSYRVEFI